MERKNRNWLYLVPVAGAVFCLWYLYTSFYDVVYSDYIRLVNSYLPDVWNPAKFWVPDLLTRVPVNLLARIINTTFFHYSIRFDQVLGVVSLALSAVSVTYYVNRKQIGTIWFLAVMAVMTFVIIQIYPFPARRLLPLSWEMNCVCCLLDIAY